MAIREQHSVPHGKLVAYYIKATFIALIHPIQWTIANPVGADRPAKRQKKSPYMSA